MIPDTHHYFGTSGVAKWKRQHQTGNLQTCHRTAKSLGGEGLLVFSNKPWGSQIQQPCSSQPAKGCSLATQMPRHLDCMVTITCGPGSCLVSKKPWLCCLTKAAGLWPETKGNLLTSKPTEPAKSGSWVSAQVPLGQCLPLSCWEL